MTREEVLADLETLEAELASLVEWALGTRDRSLIECLMRAEDGLAGGTGTPVGGRLR